MSLTIQQETDDVPDRFVDLIGQLHYSFSLTFNNVFGSSGQLLGIETSFHDGTYSENNLAGSAVIPSICSRQA
jgi:hypothetical protein